MAFNSLHQRLKKLKLWTTNIRFILNKKQNKIKIFFVILKTFSIFAKVIFISIIS